MMEGLGPRPGEGGQLVAVVVVIGKGPELEIVEDVVVLEFQLGPAADIAGEEALREVGAAADLVEDVDDARIDGAIRAPLGESAGQGREVAVQEKGDVIEGGVAPVFAEDLHGDGAVGATGDLDAGEVWRGLEGIPDRVL